MPTAASISKPHRYLILLALTATLRAQTDLRTISGSVTNSSHEPLRGAIVELENTANHEVVSYITTADGHYIFQRIDSHTDVRIWATFRGHKSAIHNIGMFDDHLDKVIRIVCPTF